MHSLARFQLLDNSEVLLAAVAGQQQCPQGLGLSLLFLQTLVFYHISLRCTETCIEHAMSCITPNTKLGDKYDRRFVLFLFSNGFYLVF